MALSFDAAEDRNLANTAKADAPAKLEGDNSLVPGKFGQAVQFKAVTRRPLLYRRDACGASGLA
jgi:hypothetical protein